MHAAGARERKQWAGLRFTPGELGDNPFQALSARLAPMLPNESITSRKLAEHLEANPWAIVQLAETALRRQPPWAELLMFVDQLEELFSVVAERYRGPFINLISSAVTAPRLRTVTTIRADLYHRCLEWPNLGRGLRDASFPLSAPGLAALFEIVTGPAALAALSFEAGLPARILEDTGTEAGALALLAFALHELYESRTVDGRLTRSAYDAFGGVRGAISGRAEDTFSSLPENVQTQLANVFRELVDVDDRGVATRRRVARARLVAAQGAAALVDAFVDARLLVTDRGPDGEPVVEVANEALLREWSRLEPWIAQIANDLRLWRQTEAAAAEWERAGRDPSHLWPHERLVLAQQMAAQLGIDPAMLAEPLKSFLRAEAERLLEELERLETSHYRRAEIGDRLDRIGDPRPGVGLRPDGLPEFIWCEVQSGVVTLEHNAGTFEVERFFIARYPVTYWQYRAFLDDPQGYRNERWWDGLQRQQEPGEQYRPIGNCPAENVSWYDAMAYCRWLSRRLSYEVRLPAEWEWQQAATGGQDKCDYPWGPTWHESGANTWESRLGRTTAVGAYPWGASAQAVLDLAGNVWEWCLNRYDQPEAPVGSAGTQSRPALRGGSWNLDRAFARCKGRHHERPDTRDSATGFRLVRVAPPE
jgi:hypothetical protein